VNPLTVRRAVGEFRIVRKGPAVIFQPGDRVSNRDRAVEFLERAIDQGAMRPRAAVCDIKVIAAGLRLEARRAVRADAVAELAFRAAECAVPAGFLRQFFVAPHAVDQHTHQVSPRSKRYQAADRNARVGALLACLNSKR
jgi:hypothetical protein